MLKCEKVRRQFVYRTIKRSGRPRTVRTRLMKLKKRIERNPRRSIRKMARDFAISPRTLRQVVHEDLGLKSLKRRKVHMLTKSIREKRLKRSRDLLSRATTSVLERILFPDEKMFTIEQAFTPKMTVSCQAASKRSQRTLGTYSEVRSQLQLWCGWNILEFPNKSNFCPSWCQN